MGLTSRNVAYGARAHDISYRLAKLTARCALGQPEDNDSI